MAYEWSEDAQASFRLPVGLNADGDIAYGSDDIAGKKSLTFGYVDNTATLSQLVTGVAAGESPTTPYSGLGGVFVRFLLTAQYDISGAKKSVTYSAEEVA